MCCHLFLPLLFIFFSHFFGDHCSHFCSSFSATACAQLSQSTSQVAVMRRALAFNPNESTVQSVGKLSERIKECKIHHHVVCCDHCSHFCSSFSAIFLSLLTPLFIILSYDICTATTVNQPGHCDERSISSDPKRVCCSTTFLGPTEYASSQGLSRGLRVGCQRFALLLARQEENAQVLPDRVPGYKHGDLHGGACASAARPCSWLQAWGSSQRSMR